MATGAKLGYTSLLKRGNGASPETFTTVAEVRGLSGFGVKRALRNVTNLDSAGGSLEYIAALKDGAEISLKVNFLPANPTQTPSTGLIGDADVDSAKNFKLQLPSGFGTFNFAAVNLGWQADEITPEAEITGTFTLKISGPITWQNLP